MPDPYYQDDLALVHDRGFGFHAAACAPGIIDLLSSVRERGGLVLELGCGSGLLTRRLADAGHRVVATDASPAMLRLAELAVDGAAEIRRLTLPHDPLPEADAIVAIGHPFNYLPTREDIEATVEAVARALAPGGIAAFDICDLSWGQLRAEQPPLGRCGPDWAIITEFSTPSPDRFVREMTTFVPDDHGLWRRSFERHENVLVDTSTVPGLMRRHGVEAEIRPSFGSESLPDGLQAVVGTRPYRD